MNTACSARLYIDAILIAAAKLTEGLEMSVDEMRESPWVRGPIDYLFHYKMIRVCVAEGKNDSITHGISQNFAQLSAVRYKYNRQKRKRDESPKCCYGIATTFSLWVFKRVDGNGASISDTCVVDPRDAASIRKMIISVMLLLRHCKGEVDKPMASEKQRRDLIQGRRRHQGCIVVIESPLENQLVYRSSRLEIQYNTPEYPVLHVQCQQ